jgi:DNA invertase Pin-like site-specific DNA recombinase
MWGMIYGYARVSTEAQDLTGTTAQLKAAGCQKIYREKIPSATADRPQLKRLVAVLAHGPRDYALSGNALVCSSATKALS